MNVKKTLFAFFVSGVLVAIIGYAHDRIIGNLVLKAFKESYTAEQNKCEERLVLGLCKSADAALEFKKDYLAHKTWIAKESERILEYMTNSEFAQSMTGPYSVAIYMNLADIAFVRNVLEGSTMSYHAYLIARNNARIISRFTDEEISELQQAIAASPEELLLYDLICRSYLKNEDYENVVRYAELSSGIAGEERHRKDIVSMMHTGLLELGRNDDAKGLETTYEISPINRILEF